MAKYEDGSYGSAAGIALIAKVLAGRCAMKYTRVAVGKGNICFPTQRSSGGLFWQKGGGLRNTFISRSANAARFVGLTLLILQTDKSTRSSARQCWSRFTTPA